ncbi:HTH-type transcriptional activator IlvY [Amphritea balenae]|uniref:HTH-type transcriptional activator IlvY n=1 Tax=Amphritea balenae TaxID=452629 RepID=A0A3P1SIY6_9GAMM|nr:HTH-type transcriptional activator IlvY [Amphritea balenae]RRC96984.1 HTH-type transcriptional activator IlvY [Amphritea balenae]GGK85085.1 transcriptional regulator IlvY [Amphritea balenae]
MDTKSLKLFISLCDSLHFGRASEACHISPSALTRTIKQLEESLGVQLFERDNRTVSLTKEGERFQEYAREALIQWDVVRNSLLEGAQELQGEISVYCSVTASYSFLYDILSEFRQLHPKIEIKLHTGDAENAIPRVLAGDEDITIAARPDSMPASLDFKHIASSPLVFIAPKLNSELDQLLAGPMNWAEIPMILSEEGVSRKRIDRWFKQHNVKPLIYAQVAGNEAIVSMVSLGFGVGVVPKIVLDNSPLSGRVRILPVEPQLKDYDVGLFALKKKLQSPLIDAFWSQIR